MFLAHIAFSLEFMALAAGIFLVAWAMQKGQGPGVGISKIFGYIIAILSIIIILNTISETVRVWRLRSMIGANIMMQQQQMRMKNLKTSAADQAPGAQSNAANASGAASQNT